MTCRKDTRGYDMWNANVCGWLQTYRRGLYSRKWNVFRTTGSRVRVTSRLAHCLSFFFLWRYSPNLGLGLPPWNSPFHFSLLDLRHPVGLLGRVISSSQGLYLNTGQHKHRINAYTHQTSMPWVGFEPTIPVSERAKTVHALDLSATVTGTYLL
jgi:hypothetical protein